MTAENVFDMTGVQGNSKPAHPPRRAPDDEKSFLWCVLESNGRAIADAEVRVDQIGNRLRGVIYGEMLKLHADTGSIDRQELRSRLRRCGDDAPELVAELIEIDGLTPMPCIIFAARYAENIIDAWCANEMRREMSAAFSRLEKGEPFGEIAEALKLFVVSALENQTTNKKNPFEKFDPLAIRDFLAEQEQRPLWLIDDLLPAGGISVIVGKPKAGKSTLMWDAAYCVATGTPFLSRRTTKGAVLLLALEDKRAELRVRFAKMGFNGSEPFHLWVDVAHKDALAWLRYLVDKYRPALVIIDPLFRFLRIQDTNNYAEVTNRLEPLVEIARTSGTHIAIVHHANKGERTDGESILGSQAIFAAADTAMIVTRNDGTRTVKSIQRYGFDMAETVIELGPTGAVTVAGRLEDVQQDRMKVRIKDLLADGPRSQSEIRDEIGGDQVKIFAALKDLFARKEIGRIGKGGKGDPYRYHLPSWSGSDLPVSCLPPKGETTNNNDSAPVVTGEETQ